MVEAFINRVFMNHFARAGSLLIGCFMWTRTSFKPYSNFILHLIPDLKLFFLYVTSPPCKTQPF